MPRSPDFMVTPRLFDGRGCPPVLVSPDALYSGFRVERYIHDLPESEARPFEDLTVVLNMRSYRFTRELGGNRDGGLVQAGNVCVIPRGLTARWSWEDIVDVVHLRMEQNWLSGVVEASGESHRNEFAERLNSADAQMQRLLLSLYSEVEAGCPGGRLFGESLATALAVHLLAHYAVHPVKLKSYQRGLGKSDLARVLAYIHDRLGHDLALSDLAASVSLSPYHFSRLFKQSTGQSPHQYVLAQRVERAKELLRRGGLTIGQVSQVVGFSDQSHVQRHFKRLTSLTPRQFAKR